MEIRGGNWSKCNVLSWEVIGLSNADDRKRSETNDKVHSEIPRTTCH